MIFTANLTKTSCPISSMYGIFTYIYHKNQPNVGKYTRHGWFGCRQCRRDVSSSTNRRGVFLRGDRSVWRLRQQPLSTDAVPSTDGGWWKWRGWDFLWRIFKGHGKKRVKNDDARKIRPCLEKQRIELMYFIHPKWCRPQRTATEKFPPRPLLWLKSSKLMLLREKNMIYHDLKTVKKKRDHCQWSFDSFGFSFTFRRASQHLGFVEGGLFTLYHGKSPIAPPCFSHYVFYFFQAFFVKNANPEHQQPTCLPTHPIQNKTQRQCCSLRLLGLGFFVSPCCIPRVASQMVV